MKIKKVKNCLFLHRKKLVKGIKKALRLVRKKIQAATTAYHSALPRNHNSIKCDVPT